MFDRTSDEMTYYVVGNNIVISDSDKLKKLAKKPSSALEQPIEKALRKSIPNDEILQSLPKLSNTSLRLFSNIAAAIEYSRYLRKGDIASDRVTQPAVFTVRVSLEAGKKLRDNSNKHADTITINSGKIGTSATGVHIKNKIYDNVERSAYIHYYEVLRQDIQPISATLHVHCAERDKFRKYGSAVFPRNTHDTDAGKKNEDGDNHDYSRRRCRVM